MKNIFISSTTELIRCYSTKSRLSTFYDVLNLKPGCTKKEIRNSFIKLSKLNHPDICGPTSNDRFVRINEAYNTLIDENKKKLYDETLARSVTPIYYHYPQRQNRENWKEAYNNPSNNWLSSNVTLAGICLSILIIGSIIRYYGAKKSVDVRSMLIDESNELFTMLEEKDKLKMDKTNDELIKIFEKNIAKEYGQIVQK